MALLYASVAELRQRLRLSDDNITDALLTSAIETSEGAINSYIDAKYQLPVTTNNHLKGLALDFAAFEVAKGHAQDLGLGEFGISLITVSKDDSIKALEAIRDGKNSLEGNSRKLTPTHQPLVVGKRTTQARPEW
jgi:hypothetical protein